MNQHFSYVKRAGVVLKLILLGTILVVHGRRAGVVGRDPIRNDADKDDIASAVFIIIGIHEVQCIRVTDPRLYNLERRRRAIGEGTWQRRTNQFIQHHGTQRIVIMETHVQY